MESPRLLIARLSAIGDVILTMPVACALRRRFPGAFLVWVVESKAAALLDDHEALDELIVLPKGWLKSLSGVWRLRQRLRALKIDTAIDPQGLTKSALVGWLSGAPRRIGFARPRARELSPWLNNELVATVGPHVIDHQLELLRPLGVTSPEVRFGVSEKPSETEFAVTLVKGLGLDAGFAVINPGAGWPSKLWPTDRYAAVAQHLGSRWRLPSLVVWAGSNERTMAERIVVSVDGFAHLAPATTLRELAAVSRRARLFVGADTGPLHLAVGVGTPCVGLYGPWPAEVCGPYGDRHIAIQKMRLDGPSHKRRKAPPTYMEAIDVRSVCEACDRILAGDQR